MKLDLDLKRMATAQNFAALATLTSSGYPRNHIVWVDADEEHLLIVMEVHTAKFKDLARDPKATVTIINAENPYAYIEARGRMVGTIEGQEAEDYVDRIARRYTGREYTNPVSSELVVVRIEPEFVYKNGF